MGWHPDLRQIEGERSALRKPTIHLNIYSFYFAVRDEFNLLHSSSKVIQQYTVDAHVKTADNRLQFIRDNQLQLRCDSYRGLMDRNNNLAEENNTNPGRMLILPSNLFR